MIIWQDNHIYSGKEEMELFEHWFVQQTNENDSELSKAKNYNDEKANQICKIGEHIIIHYAAECEEEVGKFVYLDIQKFIGMIQNELEEQKFAYNPLNSKVKFTNVVDRPIECKDVEILIHKGHTWTKHVEIYSNNFTLLHILQRATELYDRDLKYDLAKKKLTKHKLGVITQELYMTDEEKLKTEYLKDIEKKHQEQEEDKKKVEKSKAKIQGGVIKSLTKTIKIKKNFDSDELDK